MCKGVLVTPTEVKVIYMTMLHLLPNGAGSCRWAVVSRLL